MHETQGKYYTKGIGIYLQKVTYFRIKQKTKCEQDYFALALGKANNVATNWGQRELFSPYTITHDPQKSNITYIILGILISF